MIMAAAAGRIMAMAAMAAVPPPPSVEFDCVDADSLKAALKSSVAHRRAGSDVQLKLSGRITVDRPLVVPQLQPSPRTGMPPKLFLRGPAVLDGGIDVTGWTRDPLLPWLYSASLPKPLRTRNESITQLFDGNKRVPLARTQTLHYTRVGRVNTTAGWAGSLVLNSSDGIPGSFTDLSAVRLFIYHSWDVSYHRLAEIRRVPGTTSGIELVVSNKIKTLWGVGAGAPGFRCFLEGAREFLRRGSATFVHDAAGKRLLYAPADGEPPGATVVPWLAEILRTDGTSDVVLQDITFQV
eukprot:SAG31_NODE_855_length_11461_cov_5.496215_2_plen_295_part_00